MKKKYTITIGIPAHNEAKNIGNMLKSLLGQKAVSYKIEKIYIVCDGCTDNTEKIVKKFASKNKKIKVINYRQRLGKAIRLNQILRMNKSDFLIFFDADIILGKTSDVEEMVKIIAKDQQLNVAAANQLPAAPISFINKISNASFMLLKEMANFNNGNHIHNLQGCASILRKEFVKSFSYPKGTITDQGYLYIKAIAKNKNGFGFAKNTNILFRAVSTFKDYRMIAARAIYEDKSDLVNRFGQEVLERYKVPKLQLMKAILKRCANDPIYTPLSMVVNIWARLFPYKKAVSTNGKWEVIRSTKRAIVFK